MRLPEVSRTIQVPDDVTLNVVGKTVSVKGAKGNLTRDFSFATVAIEGQGKNVRISAKWPRKKEAALVGTLYSHINNMINRRHPRLHIQDENRLLSLPNHSQSTRQNRPNRKLHRRT